MNSSIYSADRTTHLRIVALALVISIAIVGFAISMRIGAVTMQASSYPGQVQRAGHTNQAADSARAAPRRI
jgi:hypothetical protein